jgi:hypothetical protein
VTDAHDRWLAGDMEPEPAEPEEPVRDMWLEVDELAAKRAETTVVELREARGRERRRRKR